MYQLVLDRLGTIRPDYIYFCLLQLDVKTKLCIRDSLYRLARSVQQRNDFDLSPASSSYGNIDAQYSVINNGYVSRDALLFLLNIFP